MTILVGEPQNDLYPWRTSDGKFNGVLIPPVTLTSDDGSEPIHMPAGALLFVPKYHPNERPSGNKYSPTIVEAPTIEDLKPALEAWLKLNEGKKLWDLRTR